jgi:hypothetical protein
MKRTLLIIILSFVLGCASTAHFLPQGSGGEVPLQLASLGSVAGGPLSSSARLEPSATASLLIEQGFFFMDTESFKEAATAFRGAIATNRLNPTGQAMSYWHVFIVEHRLGNYNASAEALSCFIVVAQDSAELRKQARGTQSSRDFFVRFEMEDKISQARAILSATWSNRSFTFGRTSSRAVPVNTQAELDYFLDLMEPCSTQEPESSHSRNVLADQGQRLQEVTFVCATPLSNVSYFFDLQQEL